MYYPLISSMNKVGVPSYPSSLKLFIDAGNPLSYSGSGTTVIDLIGTQNGTLINGVGYSSSNGGYFTFDGTNDYIDFGTNTAIQPVSTATYSCWAKINGQGTLWSFSNYTISRGGILTWMDGNGLRSLLSNSITSALQAVQFSDTTTLWKYITLAFDGTTVKTYINTDVLEYRNLKVSYLDLFNEFMLLNDDLTISDSMLYNGDMSFSLGTKYWNMIKYFKYLNLLDTKTEEIKVEVRHRLPNSQREFGKKTIYYKNEEFVQNYILIKEDNLDEQYKISFDGKFISYCRI